MEIAAGRVLSEHADGSGRRTDQAQHELDQRRLAGPVVADERDSLPGVQGEGHILHGLDGTVALGNAGRADCGRHWIAFFTAPGAIRGWLSTTPPGRRAGNWAWAQRITWTAGLDIRIFACGEVHSTWSIRSFGR
ncbi:hypothetical protein D3C72_1866480 [compost metagenome]